MTGSVINQRRPSLRGYPRNLHQALQPLPLPSGGGLNDPRQQWNMTGGLLPAPVGSLLTSKSCATINLTSLLFSLTLCPQYCSSLTSFFLFHTYLPYLFSLSDVLSSLAKAWQYTLHSHAYALKRALHELFQLNYTHLLTKCCYYRGTM